MIHLLIAIDCGYLPNIRNGRLILSGTGFRDTATYLCKEGFDLIGDRQRKCGEDGEWSTSEPKCESEYNYNNNNNSEYFTIDPYIYSFVMIFLNWNDKCLFFQKYPALNCLLLIMEKYFYQAFIPVM